jgi:polyphosphate kinase 2 (PPK2 family)
MNIKGPQLKKYLNKFVVEPEKKVRLKNYDPGWAQNETLKQMSEDAAQDLLEKMLVKDRAQLDEAQALLAASHQHSALIVLQGMDTAGKDGTIRHVM